MPQRKKQRKKHWVNRKKAESMQIPISNASKALSTYSNNCLQKTLHIFSGNQKYHVTIAYALLCESQARSVKMMRKDLEQWWRAGGIRHKGIPYDQEDFKKICNKYMHTELHEEVAQCRKNYGDDPRFGTFKALVKVFPEFLIELCNGPKD